MIRAAASARVLIATAVATLSAAVPAAAETITVAMPGVYYDPSRIAILPGDVVRWQNTSSTTHTITSAAFDSGYLEPAMEYSRDFTERGQHLYHCRLHDHTMLGEVEVVEALLEAPADPVPAGTPVELKGRVAARTSAVTIERLDEGRAEAVATVAPAADGRFSATVSPTASSRYHAVAGSAVSAPVAVQVSGLGASTAPVTPSAPAQPAQPAQPLQQPGTPPPAATRHRVSVAVAPRKRFLRIAVTVDPAPAGSHFAVLQFYSRERFTWRRWRRAKLDAAGRASFRVPASRRRHARVVVIAKANRKTLATSRRIPLRRPARR